MSNSVPAAPSRRSSDTGRFSPADSARFMPADDHGQSAVAFYVLLAAVAGGLLALAAAMIGI